MMNINDLDKMALQLDSIRNPLQDVSHYKVNRKIYDFMKTIEHGDIIYHAGFDALLLNGKPVFLDDELEDGIATYKHKDPENNEPINLYSPKMMIVRPIRVAPMRFMVNI